MTAPLKGDPPSLVLLATEMIQGEARKAQAAGLSPAANPYPPGTIAYGIWRDEWPATLHKNHAAVPRPQAAP